MMALPGLLLFMHTRRGLARKPGSKLYCVDKSTARIRQMRTGELKGSKDVGVYTDEAKRKVMDSHRAKGEPDYLAVLRYLNIGEGEDKDRLNGALQGV